MGSTELVEVELVSRLGGWNAGCINVNDVSLDLVSLFLCVEAVDAQFS